MAKSAIEAVSFPHSTFPDTRVQVDPATSPPYNWICSLDITDAYGDKWAGTGFAINLPNAKYEVIVTAGHCTYIKGDYASSIIVQFPGEEFARTIYKNGFYASPEYIKHGDVENDDYGLILIPKSRDVIGGFGWSADIEDTELDKCSVTSCGYPTDKPAGTLWVTGGRVTSYTEKRIFYENNSIRKQSGSPVYTWHKGYWTVVGVHSNGGSPNSASRFTIQVISCFLKQMQCKKTLKSVHFPDVYIRCDASDVKESTGPGGGTVNCQYKPPQCWEQFYVIPLEMPPSLVKQPIRKVVIESAEWKNAFLRLEDKQMTEFRSCGGGKVNLQFGAMSYEQFILKEEGPDDVYSIVSIVFPHCRIRVDGKRVTSWLASGSGTVNCQYFGDVNVPAKEFEKIQIKQL
ncbi:uncharacterized protein LOC135332067 [Halichondria panicea]|uniref:uncharacterized protein LOC135332067 n=1 Tax=Halichondria panicea TaxID=6063 RepID=UPI00312B9DEE